LRGQGSTGWFGWYEDAKIEALTTQWLQATNDADCVRLTDAIQREAFDTVPSIQLGKFLFGRRIEVISLGCLKARRHIHGTCSGRDKATAPSRAARARPSGELHAIPFLAVLPLVIVWLGIGEGAKVFLVAFGVAFPIYMHTVLGIRQVDPKLVELGRVTGLSTGTLIRRIILPGALPSILNGVRYALATAWLALVVAEAIAASSGIGFLAMDAREFLRTDVIVLVIVIYAAIGVAADSVAKLLERRLLAWHPNYARDANR
jgi:ABC-type proline/glycine betaine transport system permease subunit